MAHSLGSLPSMLPYAGRSLPFPISVSSVGTKSYGQLNMRILSARLSLPDEGKNALPCLCQTSFAAGLVIVNPPGSGQSSEATNLFQNSKTTITPRKIVGLTPKLSSHRTKATHDSELISYHQAALQFLYQSDYCSYYLVSRDCLMRRHR